MFKKLIIATVAAVALSGCTAIQYGKDNPATAALAVKSGTLAFVEQVEPINQRVQRAREVIAVVQYVMSQVDSGTSTTIDDLAQTLRDEISWNDKDAYERLLLDSLVFSVQEKLKNRLGDGVLDEEDRLVVSTVLQWAEQAANMYAEGKYSNDV